MSVSKHCLSAGISISSPRRKHSIRKPFVREYFCLQLLVFQGTISTPFFSNLLLHPSDHSSQRHNPSLRALFFLHLSSLFPSVSCCPPLDILALIEMSPSPHHDPIISRTTTTTTVSFPVLFSPALCCSSVDIISSFASLYLSVLSILLVFTSHRQSSLPSR